MEAVVRAVSERVETFGTAAFTKRLAKDFRAFAMDASRR